MYRATLSRAKRAAGGAPCSIWKIDAPIIRQPRVARPLNARYSPVRPDAGPVRAAAGRGSNSVGRSSRAEVSIAAWICCV